MRSFTLLLPKKQGQPGRPEPVAQCLGRGLDRDYGLSWNQAAECLGSTRWRPRIIWPLGCGIAWAVGNRVLRWV